MTASAQSTAKDLLDRVQHAFDMRHGYAQLATPLDDQLASRIEAVIATGAYVEVDAMLNEETADMFLTIAKRFASLAVRQQNPQLVVIGLVALAWGGLGASRQYVDVRDALRVQALFCRSAELLGTDPEVLFHDAASAVDQLASTTILGYLTRENKSIKHMWFTEGTDSQGRFLYVEVDFG
jgi:hypothetical protein